MFGPFTVIVFANGNVGEGRRHKNDEGSAIRIFKAMDTDHDGTVSLEEMQNFMRDNR